MKLTPVKRIPVFIGALILGACASTGSGLNSDMIRDTFGNYGVEVLSENDSRRTSSLYSSQGKFKTTRTYAVVEYTGRPRQAYASEHEKILSGASIGSTFRDAGWDIRKQQLFIGELEVPATYGKLAEMMEIALPQTLATHQYLFIISRDETSFNYATITEIHHPEFLTVIGLKELYGEILFDDSNRDSIHDFLGPPPLK